MKRLIIAIALLSSVAQAQHCDLSIWKHVYHQKRLTVLKTCQIATGVLVKRLSEADGDDHWQLKLDQLFGNLKNDVNVKKQDGNLVVEPICVHPVKQADALTSCRGFRQSFPAMKIGAHVRVTGPLVEDNQHGGWREIHAPTSVEVLK